jgi:hypothetical protein
MGDYRVARGCRGLHVDEDDIHGHRDRCATRSGIDADARSISAAPSAAADSASAARSPGAADPGIIAAAAANCTAAGGCPSG